MNRRSDFARVRREGESAASRYFVMATVADPVLAHLRIGLITSRRVGKAVIRNRVRRRFRSLLSKYGDRIESGRYLVMVARYRAGEATFEELEKDWLRLAKRLRILKDDP
jgi:ribonuclease P protein component